jgi:hypothetical protein
LKSAPGQVTPGAFEHNQQQRKPDKPRKNSNCKCNTAAQNFSTALARLLNKSEDFQ